LGANIGVADSYYTAGDPIFQKNCSWKRDMNLIYFKCTELHPEEVAYLIIPLNPSRIEMTFASPEDEKRFWEAEPCCLPSAWYKSYQIPVSGARVLKNTSGALARLEYGVYPKKITGLKMPEKK
jgi:hypothetical protein